MIRLKFFSIGCLVLSTIMFLVSCDQPKSQSTDEDELVSDLGLAMDTFVEQEIQDQAPVMEDMHISNLDAMIEIDMTLQSPTASCEVPLGGEAWDNMVIESQPGFETALMAVSLDELPDELDLSTLSRLFKGLIAYMLDIPIESLGDRITKEEVLSRGILGRVVAASFAVGLDTPLGFDITFMRRGLHRYYHCDKEFPLTLEGFKNNIFDYTNAESTEFESIAKCGSRRIITQPNLGVYVAETLVDGVVRETEILLQGRRNDGNLDFIIYNSAGQISDRTRFPTVDEGSEVMASSPYVCTTCHLNSDDATNTTRFDLLFPEFGPCR